MGLLSKESALRELDNIETELLCIRSNKETDGLKVNDFQKLKELKNDLQSLMHRMGHNLSNDSDVKELTIIVKELMTEIETVGNDLFLKKEQRNPSLSRFGFDLNLFLVNLN